MNAIDALKRLERAGSENSRTTQKLIKAVAVVGAMMGSQCPEDTMLPRGYLVSWAGYEGNDGKWNPCMLRLRGNITTDGYGQTTGDLVALWDSDTGNPYGDSGNYYLLSSRETALAFAADVASGLLDEISEFLERRATEQEQAIALLKAR